MRFFSVLAVITALVLGTATQARAEERSDALATVAKAAATVRELQSDEHFPEYWQPSLARARAVLIIPSFYKAGFLIGGAYGNGVLLVRDDSGAFSPPAFYRMTAGSLGLQIGAEEREIMYMIMTPKGLQAIMEDKFKVGAGVNLSIATWGGGAEAATTSAAGADIVAFSHAAGAYGGGVIEGAGIENRVDWNRAVYGPNATAKSIVFDRRYTLQQADILIDALNSASNFQPSGASSQSNANTGAYSSPQTTAEPPAPKAAPKAVVETQSLDAPPSGTPSSSTSVKPSSSSGGAVKLVPQQGGNLQ